MALSSPLLSFATELLDHICSFVHSPRDLLSFALCSRRLSAIIIPRHIQYRDLVCSIEHRDLLQKLQEHPHLSSRFVSLELCCSVEGLVWPKSLVEDDWPTMSKLDAERVRHDLSTEIAPGFRSLIGLTSFRC